MTAPALAFDAPPAVVAALLDLAAGNAAAGSPVRERLGAPVALSEPVLRRLAAVGATTPGGAEPSPALRRAVRVLLAARTRIDLRLWSSTTEVETSVHLGADASEGGVGLTASGDRLRWTFPVTLEAVAELADEGFLSTTHRGDPGFGALLDPDATRTLFGVLDWIRSGGGTPARDEEGSPVVRFDPDAACAHHASGVARATGRLFAPYVLLCLGPARGFDRSRWQAASSRLIRAGLLAPVDGGLALGAPIRALAATSTALAGALHWEVATRDADGTQRRSCRIVLALGSAGALALDRVPDGVLLHMPAIDELRADLRSLPVAASPRVGARFCRKCGAALRSGKAFCPACGAPVRRT